MSLTLLTLAGLGWTLYEDVDLGMKVRDLLLGSLVGRLPYAAPLQLRYLFRNKISPTPEQLKAELIKNPMLNGPIRCTGTYMPGSLLVSGWWERQERQLSNAAWGDNSGIQSWLWNGFEQWAPSWDTNLWTSDGRGSVLFGQIGTHDEADSIPVIIEAGSKADVVRDEMNALLSADGRFVTSAAIDGVLLTGRQLRRHASADVRSVAETLERAHILPSHCIVVQEDNRRHRVELRTKETVELYSGYLWKCVCPKEFKDQQLKHSYFAWEHTNFADRDAINYNIDALDHKIQYIAQKRKVGGSLDDLFLLQHMMPENRLRGEPDSHSALPEINAADFMRLLSAGE